MHMLGYLAIEEACQLIDQGQQEDATTPNRKIQEGGSFIRVQKLEA